MFNFDKNENNFVGAKIIGVGDFGAEMVNQAIANSILNVGFAVVATKNETLLKSSAPQRIKVEDSITEKSKRIFSELISNVDLLFIFTNLEDENISKQIAELSKDILTVAIVPDLTPNKEEFQNLVDTLISVEEKNSEMMLNVVRCVNSLIEPGLIGLDFADVRSVLKGSGRGYIFYGKATGKTPTVDAMKNAINSAKNILSKSKRILICIIGHNENLSMMEVNEAVTELQEKANEDAEIIFGVTPDVTNEDFVEIIFIATY